MLLGFADLVMLQAAAKFLFLFDECVDARQGVSVCCHRSSVPAGPHEGATVVG